MRASAVATNRPPRVSLRGLQQLLRDCVRRVRTGEMDRARFSRSVALGVFIGLMPIHGFQSALWFALVLVLPIDPLISWGCSWIGNAITALPLTWLELNLGAWLCRGRSADLVFEQLKQPDTYARLGLELTVGALTLGIASALVAHGLAWMAAEPTKVCSTRVPQLRP